MYCFKIFGENHIMWQGTCIAPIHYENSEESPLWLLRTGNKWVFKHFRRSIAQFWFHVCICSHQAHFRGSDPLITQSLIAKNVSMEYKISSTLLFACYTIILSPLLVAWYVYLWMDVLFIVKEFLLNAKLFLHVCI